MTELGDRARNHLVVTLLLTPQSHTQCFPENKKVKPKRGIAQIPIIQCNFFVGRYRFSTMHLSPACHTRKNRFPRARFPRAPRVAHAGSDQGGVHPRAAQPDHHAHRPCEPGRSARAVAAGRVAGRAHDGPAGDRPGSPESGAAVGAADVPARPSRLRRLPPSTAASAPPARASATNRARPLPGSRG